MKTKSGKLNCLQVPNPCPADWQQMTGNESTRFCASCNRQVYNLSAMTRLQAESLISAKGNQLCIRFTRHADGTIVNRNAAPESPLLHQIAGRRASPVASALLTAIMSTTPCIAAASQTPPSVVSVVAKDGEATPEPHSSASTANLSGVVVDEGGAAITEATLWLTNEDTGEALKSVSSEEGKYHFEVSGKGIYILKVEAQGFRNYETHGLSLTLANRRQMKIHLRAERKSESLGGAMAIPREPLRELYTESDRVVIATVGKAVKVKTEDESKLMKVPLEVSSTLKGEPKSTIYLYESLYQDEKSKLVKGEKGLFFLQRSDDEEERGGYSLTGWEGHKKLPDEDLPGYGKHLEGLATILDQDEPALSDITEWLVRCAEDKATQSEAMEEFNEGLRDLRYLEERKARELNKDSENAKDKTESNQQEEELTEVEEEEIAISENQLQEIAHATDVEFADEGLSERAKLVRLLTPSQKERLLNLIFAAEKLEDVSTELIDFAQGLKDARLAPFLLSHLQATQNAPTDNAFYYVSVIANLLGNQKLSQIADEFEKYESSLPTDSDTDEDSDADESDEAQAKPERDEAKISQERSEFVKRFLAAVNKSATGKEEKRKLQ